MANKDHSLDEKIVEAARNEFLEVGYRNASMRKIVNIYTTQKYQLD